MKKRTGFSYFAMEGLRAITLHGFMSFAATSIIVACLIITGSIALIAVNIGAEIVSLQEDSEVAIFIDDVFTREEAEAIGQEILAIPNVSEALFVSKETAFEEFVEDIGQDAEVFEGLDGENNPLRDGYRIKLVDASLLTETTAQIAEIDGVSRLVVQEETIKTLVQIRDFFELISMALVIALGCVSIFIISNTVKLGMFARRDEIAIMKMVGATNWFIRWPFVIEGMILGLISSVIAFFVQWGIYSELQKAVSGALGYDLIVTFSEVGLLVFGVFVGVGLIIGVGGSTMTIRKFLDV